MLSQESVLLLMKETPAVARDAVCSYCWVLLLHGTTASGELPFRVQMLQVML